MLIKVITVLVMVIRALIRLFRFAFNRGIKELIRVC